VERHWQPVGIIVKEKSSCLSKIAFTQEKMKDKI
jgi:hypothetical protein